jgi:hypothetical protein
MDLPIYLETGAFVKGTKELEQLMSIVLQQPFGSILQNDKLGSSVDVHTSELVVQENIRSALNLITGLEVLDVQITNPDGAYAVIYKYGGSRNVFSFNPITQ